MRVLTLLLGAATVGLWCAALLAPWLFDKLATLWVVPVAVVFGMAFGEMARPPVGRVLRPPAFSGTSTRMDEPT